MKLYRYEVFVEDAPLGESRGEVTLKYATLERAEAAAAMAEVLVPDVEVAINDLVEHTCIHSNAGTEHPVFATHNK